MMNIFNSIRRYANKWQEKEVRDFTPEEIYDVLSAKVVDSTYGYSVCFIMRTGGQTYIPLEIDSPLVAGDVVDLAASKLVTLEKVGEDDIYRVRAVKK